METSFSYTDRDSGYFSSDERRMITKIRKLKEQYPDRVTILAEPEDNDGCIYCIIPSEWMKIAPKRKVNLTEEQRDELRNRLRRI